MGIHARCGAFPRFEIGGPGSAQVPRPLASYAQHIVSAGGWHIERELHVDVKVILTPPCIFCIENH
jgi:hypothetical protein